MAVSNNQNIQNAKRNDFVRTLLQNKYCVDDNTNRFFLDMKAKGQKKILSFRELLSAKTFLDTKSDDIVEIEYAINDMLQRARFDYLEKYDWYRQFLDSDVGENVLEPLYDAIKNPNDVLSKIILKTALQIVNSDEELFKTITDDQIRLLWLKYYYKSDEKQNFGYTEVPSSILDIAKKLVLKNEYLDLVCIVFKNQKLSCKECVDIWQKLKPELIMNMKLYLENDEWLYLGNEFVVMLFAGEKSKSQYKNWPEYKLLSILIKNLTRIIPNFELYLQDKGILFNDFDKADIKAISVEFIDTMDDIINNKLSQKFEINNTNSKMLTADKTQKIKLDCLHNQRD